MSGLHRYHTNVTRNDSDLLGELSRPFHGFPIRAWIWSRRAADIQKQFKYIGLYHMLHDFNPLTTTAIQKLLEMIGRVRLCPSYSFATALDSDINQTAGSGGYLSMWENRCMHGTVCLLRAGQPRRAGAAAKSGQFVGQFSWVTGDPIVDKGLIDFFKFISWLTEFMSQNLYEKIEFNYYLASSSSSISSIGYYLRLGPG